MNPPLVTVLCVCYNHAPFIKHAIDSVLNQSYKPIQLIVLDDASSDDSVKVIELLLTKHPDVLFVRNEHNIGHTKTFNRGLEEAKGEFIIDLAGDDILLPNRVEVGIRDFGMGSSCCGVHYSDAEWIDSGGNSLGLHSEKFTPRLVQDEDIYKDVIERYFICSPTMMFRKEVIDELRGYDENLTYEDFDFWVRSSRTWNYWYSSEVLVMKRKLDSGHSQSQNRFFAIHSKSTYAVCKKAMAMNKTTPEQKSLNDRIRYEISLNLKLLNFFLVLKYFDLWRKNRSKSY